MKITIIGWYGTETIGDRAILVGILISLKKAFGAIEVKLGSLYPFFSERTLSEDNNFYQLSLGEQIKVDIFNSKISNELDQAIKESDILIMGGGPLMHIEPMYMVEYAFKKAKKLGKKTAILGCGVGPISPKIYKKCLMNIIHSADLIILRDSLSKNNLELIFSEFEKSFNNNRIHTSLDPAVQAALSFNNILNESKYDDYIAINLRKYPIEYGKENKSDEINQGLKNIVEHIAKKFPTMMIRLIPMHYFHMGNDDREFLNEIRLDLALPNVEVQNQNLNLYETMQVYKNAYFNIGMRFHSVLLQTLVNGKNFVLDYTEPEKGKICGFLNDIDESGFYEKRIMSLQRELINPSLLNDEIFCGQFSCDVEKMEEKMSIYSEKLNDLFSV